jgi:hemerythrin
VVYNNVSEVSQMLTVNSSSEEIQIESGFIVWSEKISIGVEAIDNDHKKLIELINRCSRINTLHDKVDQVQQVLIELVQYTSYHFSREEAIMQACGYPHLMEHSLGHQKLLSQVKTYLYDFSQGTMSLQMFNDFMKSWLIKHILASDKDYAPYCKNQEQKIADALSLNY